MCYLRARKNEEALFGILVNLENYKNLQDVEFDDDFLNSIQFRLKIEGTTLDNIEINGHITTDLLNVCNAWQNAIYSIYANIVKGKNDARGKILDDNEKKILTLVFKITEGSTLEEVKNIKDILNIFKNMDNKKALALIGGCVLIAGLYFANNMIESYNTINKENNDKEKFLAQNETINKVLMAQNEAIIMALDSSRLNIQKAIVGNKITLNKEQIREMADSIKNKKTETTKEYKNDPIIINDTQSLSYIYMVSPMKFQKSAV